MYSSKRLIVLTSILSLLTVSSIAVMDNQYYSQRPETGFFLKYKVFIKGHEQEHESINTYKVVESHTEGNKVVSKIKDSDGYISRTIIDDRGERLIVTDKDGKTNESMEIKYPIELGEKWIFDMDINDISLSNAEIVDTDCSITTPAGTFEHCIEIKEIYVVSLLSVGLQDVKHESYKWYAPNIGFIKKTMWGGYVEELVKYGINKSVK